MQKLPLDEKIAAAVSAIRSGFALSQSRTALAFSGGKDSTVLWHLIRTYFPAESRGMAVIFGNTGVEFPESLAFARKLGREWGGANFFEATPGRTEREGLKYVAQRQVLEWLVETGRVGSVLKADGKLKSTDAIERAATPEMWERFRREKLFWPKGTIKSYWWCVDQYGFPILGKAASKLQARRINIDCFLRFSETASDKPELKEYYEVLRHVRFSQACCGILKKEPSERVQAELGIDVIFKGLMASESQMRKLNFCTRGYAFKSKRDHADPFYHVNPISAWTDDDIWDYIRLFEVPYSSLYDMEYTDMSGCKRKIARNGCIGCFTDCGRKNNHMYVLRQTHPRRWKAVMRYGMAGELAQMYAVDGKKHSTTRLQAITLVEDCHERRELINQTIDERPCAFDF